ncbi:uncharacterized protein LOC134267209 [Saccostrea cucullata]|uniref:uncharacterized protein LOC134267209 n=1 Tax=Saccostrea cuccullata TaxID=36930 RepID=UPI002ED06750
MKTEFFCKTCSHDLCLQCKERHVIDPNNIYHDVVIYRERYEFIRTERCVKHPDEIYRIYCQTCELPFCYKCKGCTKPQNIDIKSAYRSYRQKCKDIFQSIGYEALYISYFLLAEIKDDRRNCHTKLSNFQLEMATRAQSLQEHIITVVDDFKILHRRIMHCVQQRKRNNVCIEKYERRSEKVTQWPIKFLFFHKKTPFPKIRDTPNFTKQHPHSLYDELNMENLIKLLSENIITDTGTRHEYLLKLLPQPVLYRSITVEGVNGVLHISCVAPDKVWVNDLNNLLLINIEGEILHRLRDINSYTGSHTVNSVGDLIYIDKNNNITKLSNENKTMSTLVKKIESRVAPCVFCSPINDDLLVGITAKLPGISKLLRYSKTGKLIRTIQKNSRDQELYENPLYITENLNGDVIVSDSSRGVVVTNRIGRHLFSYTGYSEGSRIEPYGICTDVLSHILVFDRKSSKVQILDKDGNFLSNIQTTERGPVSGIVALQYGGYRAIGNNSCLNHLNEKHSGPFGSEGSCRAQRLS